MPEQNNSDFQIPTFDKRADIVFSEERKTNIIDINKVQRGLELACEALANNERDNEAASKRLYFIADKFRDARLEILEISEISENKAA